jgi:DNA-binding response OmpR family regulator
VEAPPGRYRRRILLVEADPGLSQMLRLSLSDCEIHDSTEIEALHRLRSGERFDLYFLATRRPDPSGLAPCREVRKLAPNAPIIVWSSASWGRAEARAAGAQEYLEEPCEPGRIQDSIRSELRASLRRSIEAMRAEILAILDQSHEHKSRSDILLENGKLRTASAKRLFEQAKGKLDRELAYREFIASGGNPAHFEELWTALWKAS